MDDYPANGRSGGAARARLATARLPSCIEDAVDAGRMGLRERKKQATREAIGDAAMRLAIERGPENVRVEDIAARAGVAPRTYNNYFSCREEAIVSFVTERARRVAAALRARPMDEPLDEAILHSLMEHYIGGEEPHKDMMRVLVGTPALQREFLRTGAFLESELTGAIGERLGLDPGRCMYPVVVAAAVAGATRAAFKYWLRPETTTPYAALLERALKQVTVVAQVPPPTSPGEETTC